MPKKGWKTVTVNSLTYFKFMQWFQNSDAMYYENFTNFVSRKITEYQLEKIKLERFASQIQVVPTDLNYYPTDDSLLE